MCRTGRGVTAFSRAEHVLTLTARPCRYYCLSILDKHHHPDISFEQGMKILRMCTDELKRRLPIDFKGVSDYIRGLLPFSGRRASVIEVVHAMLTMPSLFAAGYGQGGDKGRHTGGGVH